MSLVREMRHHLDLGELVEVLVMEIGLLTYKWKLEHLISSKNKKLCQHKEQLPPANRAYLPALPSPTIKSNEKAYVGF